MKNQVLCDIINWISPELKMELEGNDVLFVNKEGFAKTIQSLSEKQTEIILRKAIQGQYRNKNLEILYYSEVGIYFALINQIVGEEKYEIIYPEEKQLGDFNWYLLNKQKDFYQKCQFEDLEDLLVNTLVYEWKEKQKAKV